MALAILFMSGPAFAEIHADVYPTPAAILQVLKAFDNPEGAIFSADGSHVFISSSAEIGDRGPNFGWRRARASSAGSKCSRTAS
jgi:hypothetical protein